MTAADGGAAAGIEIVEAPGPARLRRLAALHRAAFAPDGRGWSADEIGALAASGLLLAADDDRSFALFSLVLDEAELLTIAVRPEVRRQGRAAALLVEAMAEVKRRGGARLFLEVAADNAPARALYAAAGFEETGRRPGYYRREDRRIDAILCARAL